MLLLDRTNPLYDDREDRLLKGGAGLIRPTRDLTSSSSSSPLATASSSSGYGSNGE